jgi:hypothetical protein
MATIILKDRKQYEAQISVMKPKKVLEEHWENT